MGFPLESSRLQALASAADPSYGLLMPTWDAGQYLRFAEERTRPCRDLAARIDVAEPNRVIDLGCGPGNSTAVLAERRPRARIEGLDSSPEMIASARAARPDLRWSVGDITAWAAGDEGPFDVVFSNAALQWVDDHARVFPNLLRHVAPGGALAIQMPGNYDAAPHRLMRELAASPAWRGRFPADGVREWHVHDLDFYHDLLAPRVESLDLWATEYFHILPDVPAIVEWYRGTGLRPFLQALDSEKSREEFTNAWGDRLREVFPSRPNGAVLFPFRRLFLIARVGAGGSSEIAGKSGLRL